MKEGLIVVKLSLLTLSLTCLCLLCTPDGLLHLGHALPGWEAACGTVPFADGEVPFRGMFLASIGITATLMVSALILR